MIKRKIFAIIGITIVMISVFATSAFCNDLDAETQATTIAYTGASGIESIEFRLADGPNGGIGTTLLWNYPVYLRDSNAYDAIDMIHVDRDDDIEEYYSIRVTTNRVYGYARSSIYIASTVGIVHVVDGVVSDPPVKQMIIHYKNYAIHNYSDTFQRPYDGNIDSTIGIFSDVPWISRITYRTSAVTMADYRRDGNNYYTVNSMTSNSTAHVDTKTEADGHRYIPVGVRYNFAFVTRPAYRVYNNGLGSNQPVPARYDFSLVTSAKQEIEFETPYTSLFTITDMYSIEDNTDIAFRAVGGSPPPANGFEVGTFLRDSVESFLEFEIAEGFSLKSLLWVVVGIGAVFALLYIFIGK